MTVAKAFWVGTLVTLLAPQAWAGCPSQCNASVDPPTIDPPLPCLVITANASGSCGCDASIEIENQCELPVAVVDTDAFPRCIDDDPYTDSSGDCTELAPGMSSYERVELQGNGEWDWGYTIKHGDTEHTIRIVTHVENFDDDMSACHVAWSNPSSSGAVGSALLLLGLVARRRRSFVAPR